MAKSNLIQRTPDLADQAPARRTRLRLNEKLRLPAFLLLCSLPAFLLLVLWRALPDAAWMRWSLAGLGIGAGTLLARRWWQEHGALWWMALSALSVAAWFRVMSYLVLVNDHPLGLYWSEGNRFYDYSLVFARSLYQSSHPIQPLYNEPGRYALWGALFLLPELPIWAHRLWNAFLWTVPLVLLGILLGRWVFKNRPHLWLFALWVFVFLIQGPIYPTLILSALLVVASARWRNPGWKMAAIFAAALYAGLSRWTWLAAPAAWSVIIALLWPEDASEASQAEVSALRRGTDGSESASEPVGWLPMSRERLVTGAVLVGSGLAGGLLSRPDLFLAPQQATGFALKQPLLWYRLLPNATYAPGILLALALAAGPLALVLSWLAFTRTWRLNWLQIAVAGLPALAFLTGGVVASTKIGGGSNLHNLDMFLITLVVLAALAARALRAQTGIRLGLRAPWIQGLAALAVLIPTWNALQSGAPVILPQPEAVQAALQTIQQESARAADQGEILFMDQRQLLSFGYITGIPLVPEYEKKYMMDQAMAANAPFFRGYYDDLASRRFSLIVSHPMKVQYQGRTHNFGEENDAWSRWVAEGTLCYYKPLMTLEPVGIQLLVPRESPGANCR